MQTGVLGSDGKLLGAPMLLSCIVDEAVEVTGQADCWSRRRMPLVVFGGNDRSDSLDAKLSLSPTPPGFGPYVATRASNATPTSFFSPFVRVTSGLAKALVISLTRERTSASCRGRNSMALCVVKSSACRYSEPFLKLPETGSRSRIGLP